MVGVVQGAVDHCVTLAPTSQPARAAAPAIAASLPARAAKRRGLSPLLASPAYAPLRNNGPQGEHRSTANPKKNSRRVVSAATALAAATPAVGYDVTALLEFDLDELRTALLTTQDPPRNDEQARVLLQPLVFVWQQAAVATHSDTQTSTDRFDGRGQNALPRACRHFG